MPLEVDIVKSLLHQFEVVFKIINIIAWMCGTILTTPCAPLNAAIFTLMIALLMFPVVFEDGLVVPNKWRKWITVPLGAFWPCLYVLMRFRLIGLRSDRRLDWL